MFDGLYGQTSKTTTRMETCRRFSLITTPAVSCTRLGGGIWKARFGLSWCKSDGGFIGPTSRCRWSIFLCVFCRLGIVVKQCCGDRDSVYARLKRQPLRSWCYGGLKREGSGMFGRGVQGLEGQVVNAVFESLESATQMLLYGNRRCLGRTLRNWIQLA